MRLKASIVLLVGLLCLLQPFSLMAKTQKGFDTLYTAEFDSLFLDALCAKSSGKIQESIDLYKLCNQLNPRSAIVCYELGILYLKLDSVKLGIDYINKSCDYDPENYYYQTNLANIYSKKGMYNESLKKCEFIAKKFPQNDNVFYQLSMLYTQTGQYDKALSALDKLEKRVGINKDITFEKVRLYRTLNKNNKAIKEIENFIKESPFDESAWIFKGDLEMSTNQMDEALASYMKSLEIAPGNGYAMASLCSYYDYIGDKEKTDEYLYNIFKATDVSLSNKLAFLERVAKYYERSPDYVIRLEKIYLSMIESDPENAQVHLNYSEFLSYIGRDEECIESLRTSVYLDPSCSDCWLLLFKTAFDKEDSVMIDKVLKDAMEAVPNSPEFCYFAGVKALDEKNNADALKYIQKAKENLSAAKSEELQKSVNSLLAELLRAEGKKQEARECMLEALSKAPNDLMLMNNYAYYLALDNEELDKAAEYGAKLVEKEPLESTYLDTYAYILMKQAKYDLAIFYIRQALTYDSKEAPNFEIIEHYGDILYFLGNIDQAIEEWSKAKKINPNSSILNEKIKQKKYVE